MPSSFKLQAGRQGRQAIKTVLSQELNLHSLGQFIIEQIHYYALMNHLAI